MSETLQILLLIFTGLAAGFINVMVAGGSSLSLPALIFLGLTPTEANGTNRVAILIQNIAAVTSFKKEKYEQFNISLKLALFTVPGGLLGALLAIEIGDDLFQKILGVVLILVAISMLIPTSKKSKVVEGSSNTISIKGYLAMIVAGFYGGFIQVGVGFILMAGIRWGLQTNLIRVNMHKVFIVLVYTIPAFLVFAISDNINYVYGIILAFGNAIGGWWAAKVQVKKGENVIKIFIIIVIVLMSLKLFDLF